MENTKSVEVAKRLDTSIEQVITNSALGFEKAFVIASAIEKLKGMLVPEYMKPIMELQNQSNGFKTDRKEGYDVETVKKCLIDAVLTGVQPYGNHFNIIASNYYITKEGFGYLLKNTKGLKWSITPSLPRIDHAKGSAAVEMTIKWNGNEEKIDFAVKVNSGMGADAVIGKATRKARAWLFNTFHNTELPEGEIEAIAVEQTPEEKIADLKDRKSKLKEAVKGIEQTKIDMP